MALERITALYCRLSRDDELRICEPVQVYTACQFVKGQNISQNISMFGKYFVASPATNLSIYIGCKFIFQNL